MWQRASQRSTKSRGWLRPKRSVFWGVLSLTGGEPEEEFSALVLGSAWAAPVPVQHPECVTACSSELWCIFQFLLSLQSWVSGGPFSQDLWLLPSSPTSSGGRHHISSFRLDPLFLLFPITPPSHAPFPQILLPPPLPRLSQHGLSLAVPWVGRWGGSCR